MKSLVDIVDTNGKSAFSEPDLDTRVTDLESEIMASENIKTTPTVNITAGNAVQIPPTPVANRRSVIFTNTSTVDIWYGDSSVAVGAGTILRPGEKNALNITTGLFAISAVASTLTVNELY